MRTQKTGNAPLWLNHLGPERDVCISSRVRVMRNVVGLRFPLAAEASELAKVVELVELGAGEISALKDARQFGQLASRERDQMVAERLISAEFSIHAQHRKVWLNSEASLSLMINEEDHVRMQLLRPGWSITETREQSHQVIVELSDNVPFAWSPRFGYLAASPYNCGDGVRISAMFHLIGLAHLKRLKRLLELLGSQSVVARGLFGENSRAIGAMVQISVLGDDLPLLLGAGDVLIAEERSAREKIGLERLQDQATRIRDFAIGSRSIPLADALRVFAWSRWASASAMDGFDTDLLRFDGLLQHLSLCSVAEEGRAAERRADVLRHALEAHRQP